MPHFRRLHPPPPQDPNPLTDEDYRIANENLAKIIAAHETGSQEASDRVIDEMYFRRSTASLR